MRRKAVRVNAVPPTRAALQCKEDAIIMSIEKDYKSYQIAFITDHGIFTTRHYGLENKVHDIIGELWEKSKDLETRDDLIGTAAKFVKAHEDALVSDRKVIHDSAPKNIEEIDVFDNSLNDDAAISFENDGHWYADYVIIRNLTEIGWDIQLEDYKTAYLQSGEGMVLNIGEFYAGCDAEIARRKLVAELDEFMDGFPSDISDGENYTLLWNLCTQYDDKQRDGFNILDIVRGADFFFDDMLWQHLRKHINSDWSVGGLRDFLGDTYDDRIYKLDSNGNLANLDKEDFGAVVDLVRDRLLDGIRRPYKRQPQSGAGSDKSGASM